MLKSSQRQVGHMLYCRGVIMNRPMRWMREEIIVTVLVLAVLAAIDPVRAYEGDPSVAGVTVSGRVLYTGSLPKPERVPVHRDSKFCGEAVSIDKIHVERASGGIDGMVISFEGIDRGKPLVPDKRVITFENRTCRFVPRTNAAVVGSTLEILNSDPILHNTHIRIDGLSGPTVINVVQPAGTEVIRKSLRTAGFFDIRCDAHTFMQASMHVFEHPYFSMTDSTGRFEMAQVPPGTYQLRMWHEALGTRTKTITVPSTGPLTVDLGLSPEE